MQKIQENARIISIEIDAALEAANATAEAQGKDLFSARMTFSYLSSSSADMDGVDEFAQTLLGQMRGGNQYSVLLNLKRAEIPENTDSLEYVKSKLVGKIVRMTTYVATIEELLKGTKQEGKFTTVHNLNNRTYSSLNNSFVGNYNDDKNVFEQLKNRLMSDVVEGTLILGDAEIVQEEPKKSEGLF